MKWISIAVAMMLLAGCSDQVGDALESGVSRMDDSKTGVVGPIGTAFCKARSDSQFIADSLLLGEMQSAWEREQDCMPQEPGTDFVLLSGPVRNVVEVSIDGEVGFAIYSRLNPASFFYPEETSRIANRSGYACINWSFSYLASYYVEMNMVEKAQELSGCKHVPEGTTLLIKGDKGGSFILEAMRGESPIDVYIDQLVVEHPTIRAEPSKLKF
jgi:hypothetical protein